MRVYTEKGKEYTQCDKLKPRPLEDQHENIGPTDSQWRTYFNYPEKCEQRATWLRLHLPKNESRIAGGYQGTDHLVLYFEHGIAIGVLATLVGGVAFGCALYWTFGQHNLSGGFGVASWIVGFVGFVAACYFNALKE
jgi:hypothetical protein